MTTHRPSRCTITTLAITLILGAGVWTAEHQRINALHRAEVESCRAANANRAALREVLTHTVQVNRELVMDPATSPGQAAALTREADQVRVSITLLTPFNCDPGGQP